MSTYSSNLRIELITTGTQAGTWGNTTNDNYQYVLEQAIAGSISVTTSSANQALTYSNGPTSTAANNQSVRAILTLDTSTGANFAVYAPPSSKLYTIKNASSYTATIYNSTVIGNTTAAGTGVAIPAGKTVSLYTDGTNFYSQNNYLFDGTTAVTQSASDNSTKVATTAYVDNATGTLGTMASQNANNVNITGGNIAGTALSSTVTGATQVLGTNNTTLATTAFVQAALQAMYPVGSIYINASDGTNPATLFGFGTWATVGDGKVMVNQDTGDASFDVLGETGGSKDAIVVSHTHTASQVAHSHNVYSSASGGSDQTFSVTGGPAGASQTTSSAQPAITVDSAGSSGTNANLQPYVVVKMWKRTA